MSGAFRNSGILAQSPRNRGHTTGPRVPARKRNGQSHRPPSAVPPDWPDISSYSIGIRIVPQAFKGAVPVRLVQRLLPGPRRDPNPVHFADHAGKIKVVQHDGARAAIEQSTCIDETQSSRSDRARDHIDARSRRTIPGRECGCWRESRHRPPWADQRSHRCRSDARARVRVPRCSRRSRIAPAARARRTPMSAASRPGPRVELSSQRHCSVRAFKPFDRASGCLAPRKLRRLNQRVSTQLLTKVFVGQNFVQLARYCAIVVWIEHRVTTAITSGRDEVLAAIVAAPQLIASSAGSPNLSCHEGNTNRSHSCTSRPDLRRTRIR